VFGNRVLGEYLGLRGSESGENYITRSSMIHTGVWWGNLRGKNHLEDPGVDERIILRWIFRNWDVGTWNGSSWLSIGTGSVP
jgi:hypothetical protein